MTTNIPQDPTARSNGLPRIASHHLEMLAESCIPPEYAAIRGYRTAYQQDGKLLRDLGFSENAANQTPGLLIPLLDKSGKRWDIQFRPDNPSSLNGKPAKYLRRPGRSNRLDFPPGVADYIDDPSVPLFVPEGVRKADAGAVKGLCTIGLLSVSSWRGTNVRGGITALADWEDIALNKGRQVIISYDSDVMRKKPVHVEMSRFARYLANKGSRVLYLHLPEENDWSGKTGLDDFFYQGYTVEDLWNFVRREPPLLEEEIDDTERQSSWVLIDLAAALSCEPIVPQFGRREDDECLLYPAKVHWVYGTHESGKTWLCLLFVAQVLLDGGTALYVDFEDDERGISQRLLQLGVSESVLKDTNRFAYIRPDGPLDINVFEQTLSRSFDVAVLDGVTESMALEGLKDVVGGDIAAWQTMLPKAIAKRTGAAVLCIDHVPKDQNNRVLPTGSQHKMSGLDGAAFKVEREQPFGRNSVGVSLVRVSKDRHAGVRAVGVDYDPTENTHLVGAFTLDAAADSFYVAASVKVVSSGSYVKRTDTQSERPTWCMEKLSLYLEATQLDDNERSQTKVVTHMWHNVRNSRKKPIARDKWREALDTLCAEGYVDAQPGRQNSMLCYSFQPYREAEDQKSYAYTPTEPLKPTENRQLESAGSPASSQEVSKRKAELKRQQAQRELESADRELAEIHEEDTK